MATNLNLTFVAVNAFPSGNEHCKSDDSTREACLQCNPIDHCVDADFTGQLRLSGPTRTPCLSSQQCELLTIVSI